MEEGDCKSFLSASYVFNLGGLLFEEDYHLVHTCQIQSCKMSTKKSKKTVTYEEQILSILSSMQRAAETPVFLKLIKPNCMFPNIFTQLAICMPYL